MSNFTTNSTKQRRESIKYNGFQFQDFINGLLDERNIIKADLSRLTKNTPKTITEWTTGLSIPNQANFQNVLNALAPQSNIEERNRYITTNTNIYESIREQYLIAKAQLNAQRIKSQFK